MDKQIPPKVNPTSSQSESCSGRTSRTNGKRLIVSPEGEVQQSPGKLIKTSAEADAFLDNAISNLAANIDALATTDDSEIQDDDHNLLNSIVSSMEFNELPMFPSEGINNSNQSSRSTFMAPPEAAAGCSRDTARPHEQNSGSDLKNLSS